MASVRCHQLVHRLFACPGRRLLLRRRRRSRLSRAGREPPPAARIRLPPRVLPGNAGGQRAA